MTPPFPAHNLMHKANRYGLASLCNLDKLPPKGAVIIAAPLKINERHRQSVARAGTRRHAEAGASMADYAIAGSGINALVAASLLSLKGKKVVVLERNDRIGGCIRTEEATAPGFTHDVMATTFVLFLLSPAYAALAPELEKRGLQFRASRNSDGVLLAQWR